MADDAKTEQAYNEVAQAASTWTDEEFAARVVGLLIADKGVVNAWQRTIESMVKVAGRRAVILANKAEREAWTQLLEAVERKLASYVGVCRGDKELTRTLLPELRRALGKGRPNNCRMAQKERGEPYPRSGCHACHDGGLRGCPYAGAAVEEQSHDAPDT